MPFSFHLMAILALFFCPLHYKEKIVKCPKFLTARSDSYYSVTRLGDFYKVLVDKFFCCCWLSHLKMSFYHPTSHNQGKGWYTSCSLFYGHTFTSHFCIIMAVVRYNHIPIYTYLTKSECIPAQINLEIIMVNR